MREVDKARLAESQVQQRLQRAEAAAKAAAEKHTTDLADALKRLHGAEQNLARRDTRVATLEEQIERLHGQLSAALTRARASSPSKKKTMKKRTTVSAPAPMVLPSYPPDDGSPTDSQIAQIRKLAADHSNRSVSSSLIESTSVETSAPAPKRVPRRGHRS